MTSYRRSGISILFVVAVVLALLLGCLSCDRTSTDKIKVMVTIYPLADFVRNVAADKVDVAVLFPPGASPHTYELTPGQVAEAAESRLLIVNGAGLDFWVEEELRTAAGGDLLVIDASMAIAVEGLLIEDETHENEGNDHGGVNPHIWLDPVLAQKQVQAIAQGLVMVDPDNRDFYLQRATRYVEELKDLDLEIAGQVSGFQPPEFISLHPAWTYFARRYGLTEAAVIQKSAGQEPSPSWTKEVIDLVKRRGIKAIFAEPQSTSAAAQSIAEEAQATVLLLDPIGGPDLEHRDSYIALMRYNINLMQEVMA